MNILDTLKPSQLKLLKVQYYKRGTTLFNELDKCNEIGIVIEGMITIVSYLKDGKEVVYNTLNKDQIFGNNLIFSSNPFYKGNIITSIDSKIAFINKKNLLNLLQTNEGFMIEYFKLQSDFTKQLNDNIRLLSIDSAEERLLFYLQKNKNKIVFNSVSELAKKLYLKRETTSRLITKLIKQNKIIRNNKSIELL